jgi:acyl-coenzyme A thioesterase PaaI-like protein
LSTLSKEHTGPKQYPNCFGCGADNPIGLRLQYRREGDAVVTEFTPGDEHEGWPDIVHGGIITTLLYEVMENFAYQNGTIAMMRSMHTSFRRPAKTGRRITATARLEVSADREMSVTATLTQNKLIAEGRAKLITLTQERIASLGIAQP